MSCRTGDCCEGGMTRSPRLVPTSYLRRLRDIAIAAMNAPVRMETLEKSQLLRPSVVLTCTSFSILGGTGEAPVEQHNTC